MTAQPLLPMVPAGAVEIGDAAGLVEDADGGRVYVNGALTHVWSAGDETGRRLAAVQLVRTKAAGATAVAAAFGVGTSTLWRWHAQAGQGAGLLAPGRRGPKGPSRLTDDIVAGVRARRRDRETIRQIAEAVGIATGSVRRALSAEFDHVEAGATGPEAGPGGPESKGQETEADAIGTEGAEATAADRPGVLAEPVPRSAERGLARAGLLEAAAPVFTPAARVPLAGLLLGLPGLQATGLLSCANEVYGGLPAGFYGLDTMLLEGVFRALAGAPRVEGAVRFASADLGRVLGMDRGPETKTIRRRIGQLATAGKADRLLEGMATRHLDTARNAAGENGDATGLVLYVDGHVRAYQGTKRIAKTHLSRLRFPAPATVETWVTDAGGDPVLVVMAEPGASLAMELRRLLPELRQAVGDDRRVLVGFDRGGWSPALFKHMSAAGFDVLTWRKGTTEDLDEEAFTKRRLVDPTTGREHHWELADTMVELPLKNDETFTMRQVTRLDTKKDAKKGTARQVHVLTTRTDLDAVQVMYRMGSRWRQENHFRYARMHLGFDSHDSYAASDDDPDRTVPNPAKARSRQQVNAAKAHLERERARADAALLAARTPAPGQTSVTVTNQLHNAITAGLREAEEELAAAQGLNRQTPTRVRLGEIAPGQQVLDTETKLVHHAIRIAAFNTTTAIARDIRINTGYARAKQEAFTLTRQVLTQSGDIVPDPDAGTLTVRLDPLPTGRETRAATELCEHLTATHTTYPGTGLTLRYETKNRP